MTPLRRRGISMGDRLIESIGEFIYNRSNCVISGPLTPPVIRKCNGASHLLVDRSFGGRTAAVRRRSVQQLSGLARTGPAVGKGGRG